MTNPPYLFIVDSCVALSHQTCSDGAIRHNNNKKINEYSEIVCQIDWDRNLAAQHKKIELIFFPSGFVKILDNNIRIDCM